MGHYNTRHTTSQTTKTYICSLSGFFFLLPLPPPLLETSSKHPPGCTFAMAPISFQRMQKHGRMPWATVSYMTQTLSRLTKSPRTSACLTMHIQWDIVHNSGRALMTSFQKEFGAKGMEHYSLGRHGGAKQATLNLQNQAEVKAKTVHLFFSDLVKEPGNGIMLHAH